MAIYQCYFDASCTPDISRCAYYVMADGQIIHTHVQEKKIRTSHKAEKHALYLLLQYIQQNIEQGVKIEIYGDAKSVIEDMGRKGIRSKRNKAGKLFDIIEPHYELIPHHIPRKQNRIAHKLSRKGYIPPLKPMNLRPKAYVFKNQKTMLLDNIFVPYRFLYSNLSNGKYQSRLLFYREHRLLYKPILVDLNGVLLDGYISYLILREHEVRECHVDMIEVETTMPSTNKVEEFQQGLLYVANGGENHAIL